MKLNALRAATTLTAILGLLLFAAVPSHATAGFAEWEVKTPGGLFICHTDPYLGRYKVWLTTDCRSEQALIERIERWRYYDGFILGESAKGKFVFNETTRAVEWLDASVALEGEGEKRKLVAVSDWLTPADGYAEGWFTPRTWKLCRFRLALEPAGSKPSDGLATVLSLPPMEPLSPNVEGCKTLMKRVDGYYRRTVLKRWCEEYKRGGEGADAQEMAELTSELCSSVQLNSK